MNTYKRAKPILLTAMAGSLALSSPFVFHLPVDAYAKEQLKEASKLKYGDMGEAVVTLHRKLKIAKYYPGNQSDKYNVLTEYAIKQFQIAHQDHVTGEIDEDLLLLLDRVVEKELTRVVDENIENIYYDDHSLAVKKVQQALKDLGIYSGKIDGYVRDDLKYTLMYYNNIQNKDFDLHRLQLNRPVQITTVEPQEEEVETHSSSTEEDIVQASSTSEQDIVHTTVSSSQDEDEDTSIEENNSQQSTEITEPSEEEKSVTSHSTITHTARSYIGSPYQWGGTSPSGFDCSGFLQYVYASHGKSMPRTVSDMWNATSPMAQPSIGHLVFFETYKPGPSHAGIYIGDGNFIHAGSSNGVVISNLSESYWQSKFIGARLVH
ncbi:NlpC/P60 family protein [Halalkalibacillus halophilus]|uniref:C40 family peptidase n=1 Tax=Halalkalibacillus halophilus TaxID=392827 RepID=UPI0003F8C222|nr:NlpC/P60 family protein [Halalkalibacillus halophilus]